MNSSYGAPWSAVDVILLPGIAFLAAWLLRFLAWNLQRNNKKSSGMTIAAWVVVLFSAYLGFHYAWDMFNPDTGHIYTLGMADRPKVKMAHYIAIALPILTIVAFLVWGRTEKKLGRPIAI